MSLTVDWNAYLQTLKKQMIDGDLSKISRARRPRLGLAEVSLFVTWGGFFLRGEGEGL
jgi:hypothetical protein